MDLKKLSVEFIVAFEKTHYEDGVTQKDKILPHMTVSYPYQGYYEVCLGDDPLSLLPHGAGCYVTAPGARHTIVHRICEGEDRVIPRWLRVCVMYDNVLDVTSWFVPPLLITGEQAKPFIQAVDDLLQLKTQPEHVQNFGKLRIAGQLMEALLTVCEYKPVVVGMERIYPAILRIKDDYSKPLSAQDLADACSMSPATFYRVFWQTVGMTPMRYLEDYRLKQASRMLITDKYTLGAIAEQCGYYDEFHLSRNFKKHFGLSPKEYKKQAAI